MPSAQFATADRVRDLFDRIAPQYDRLNDLLSLGLHRVWKEMAVKWAEPPAGGTVLDACCGSGDLALRLARRVGSQGRVVGIDLSENLLAIARQRSGILAEGDRITWQQGDALALPFEEGTFDAVTVGYGLRNVTDIPRSLREIERVLRPGRRAAILDFQSGVGASSTTTEDNPANWFQQTYLTGIVEPVAMQLGLADEYAYIRDSLQAFPDGRTQRALARDAGFERATYYDVAGGLMGVLVLQKGDRLNPAEHLRDENPLNPERNTGVY
ncbi:MAG: bifunctional demethylmenaquinone methyltransferase/2-methoxy-6-polyprenyl-1,4-benzoquinol methylase UbiE [Cyanobacteria bacterium J06639_1]